MRPLAAPLNASVRREDVMSPEPQRVTWSVEDCAVVRTVAELDSLLDRLMEKYGSGKPIIVIIEGPDVQSVYYGVGGEISFVSSCDCRT